MHDQFRKRYKLSSPDARVRHQIALEAARRMFETLAPKDEDTQRLGWLDEASEAAYYTAKRKAAAVASTCIPAAALKLSGPQSGGCR